MTIAVFGASGKIGKLLVRLALNEGYVVKAYFRDPSKLNLTHKNLQTVIGELDNYDKIKNVISGSDCVISTLGPPVKRKYVGFPVFEGHKNIIKAMKSEGVKRFITLATPSVRFDKDIPSLTTKIPTILAKLFLPQAYREIIQIGDLVKTSDLDWTIVRIIAPNNSPSAGKVTVTFGDIKIKFAISRADVAGFILNQTRDIQYIHSMPIIGSN